MNHRSRYRRNKTILSSSLMLSADNRSFDFDHPGRSSADQGEKRQGKPSSRDRRALRNAKRFY